MTTSHTSTDADAVVQYEQRGAVACITLNRPDALNAFDAALRAQLTAALMRAAQDDTIRAVVLTGAGRAFSAGADLKAGIAGIGDVHRLILDEYVPAINLIADMPKPVIAAVEGLAAGIGCAHVLASDLVVMAEAAFIMLPFMNIGLVPDGGLCWLLERQLGYRLTFELALSGDRLPAARCRDLGLVNRVVATGTALAVALEWAQQLAERPPLAVAHTKRLLRETATHTLQQMQAREADLQAQCIASDDCREGIQAFLDKRKPKFTGR